MYLYCVVQTCAKQAAAMATQTISAAQGAGPSNTNIAAQQALVDECRVRYTCIMLLLYVWRCVLEQLIISGQLWI